MRRLGNVLLGLTAAFSFLLLFQNYGIQWLPAEHITIPVEKIYPLAGEKSFAYVYDFDRSEPDRWFKPRSQLRLFENNALLASRLIKNDEVRLVGGNRWSHEPGRVLFASTDNSDPRTNGRTYTLRSPRFYTKIFGYSAATVFAAAVLGLVLLNRNVEKGSLAEIPYPSKASSTWWWHVAGASMLLLAGLYCNTGTLSPYGNTHFGYVVKETGYIYNVDHPQFKALFDFVDGGDAKLWSNALLLRRILYAVAAWPFMRVFGFEIGGTLASIVFNIAGLVATLCLLRKRIGERGAVFAGWLLALYPGATYWGGLPYPYALISPLSMLLMIAVMELIHARGQALVGLSLLMGISYLAYDFSVFFLPAALLVLLWHRRPGAAAISAGLQILPLALWLLFLSRGLGQQLENSNTSVYRVILKSFFSVKDTAAWFAYVSDFPNVGLDVWFGANFIFLPTLFLLVVALNPVTSRVRLLSAEASLLGVGLGLFLFNNLAPDYSGSAWVMRGTWIARIYQPIFPALVLFTARWWERLPSVDWSRRIVIWITLSFVATGNALIIFGPILNNPGKVSEDAFYRFYNHTDLHWLYESHLRDYGRRPLGFSMPQP